MSVDVMLARAFNQAISSRTIKFADKDADFAIIKAYMLDYAQKFDVKVTEEQVENYIKQQNYRWEDGITQFSVSGDEVDIENIPSTYKPKAMTKEEKLKDLFDFAATTRGVYFVDRSVDTAIIKNVMRAYNQEHGYGLTDDEINDYIKSQLHRWHDAVSEIDVVNADVKVNHISSTYDQTASRMTKERVLREGFDYAASSPALRFTGTDIDMIVLKSMMKEFGRTWNIELSDDEVVAYIKKEFNKMNKIAEDYSHTVK